MKRQSDELAEKMPKMLPQVRPGTAMSAQALAEAAKLLNEKQRSVADARCAVVAAVLGIKYQYDCSAKAAVAQFLGLLAEGKLDAVTLGNLEKANDRSRSAKVGERTLDGWISAYLKAENATERLVALAPKVTKAVKPIESYGWLPMFMQFHNIPSAPKLAHSYRRFVQWAEAENMPVNDVPNLSMVRRVWDKLPLIMQERGRKTGAAYKSLLPYVKRDWGALKPNDVWIGDGHSFKAKVAHPVHGRPFKPEVTVIIDGCTRFVVGFSVSLAESCVAVSDALRIGVKHFGLPIIYYSDNGGGQTGKTIDHEITGITSRLGIRHETGIAGNPSFTALVLMRKLATAAKVSAMGSLNDLFESVSDRLRDSDRLIVVDEAENLPLRALEIIRRLHDETGCGLVLSGMPRLVANLRGKHGELAQLYSRVSVALNLGESLPDDELFEIAKAALPDADEETLLELVKHSNGNTRRMSKLMRGAVRTANKNGIKLQAGIVKKYSSLIIR